MYWTLIRMKINQSCFIYGSSGKYYLKSLNAIHHEGWRHVFDGFRIFSVEIQHSEDHAPPIQLRFQKSGLKFCDKIRSLPNSSAHNCIFNPQKQPEFYQVEKEINILVSAWYPYRKKQKYHQQTTIIVCN